MRLALETAEKQCFELNDEMAVKANNIICKLNDDIEVQKKIINELENQLIQWQINENKKQLTNDQS